MHIEKGLSLRYSYDISLNVILSCTLCCLSCQLYSNPTHYGAYNNIASNCQVHQSPKNNSIMIIRKDSYFNLGEWLVY
jgi:hypothetical protein